MNHLLGNLLRRLAGNENDPAPVLLQHGGKIIPAEANPAEDVHLKKSLPVGIGDFQERLYFEYADIVHEDIRGRHFLQERINSGGSAQVGGNSGEFRAAILLAKFLERSIHAGLRSAIDGHAGAFFGERGRNGQSDSRRGARDYRKFPLQTQIHW